jgi:hypothetical protein
MEALDRMAAILTVAMLAIIFGVPLILLVREFIKWNSKRELFSGLIAPFEEKAGRLIHTTLQEARFANVHKSVKELCKRIYSPYSRSNVDQLVYDELQKVRGDLVNFLDSITWENPSEREEIKKELEKHLGDTLLGLGLNRAVDAFLSR